MPSEALPPDLEPLAPSARALAWERPMARRPVVLIHGYSDKGESFDRWKAALLHRGYPTTDVSVCSYETLTNEVTIRHRRRT
jgi:hypothetical protein